jgi:hypothetical protein
LVVEGHVLLPGGQQQVVLENRPSKTILYVINSNANIKWGYGAVGSAQS